MKIVGIDLSYAKPIKMAVLSSRGRLITVRSIEPNSLQKMADVMFECILPIGDALVVIEEMGIYNNRKTGIQLVKLSTMIQTRLHIAGVQYIEIRPQEWQKFILGKTKDKKKASIAKATEVFGAKIPHPLNNDEADALNIALYGVKNSRKLLREINAGKD